MKDSNLKFLNQKNKKNPKKYKKVILEEQESEIESDFEQEQEESEMEEIEPNKKTKNLQSKKREPENNIFDYINQKNAKRYK